MKWPCGSKWPSRRLMTQHFGVAPGDVSHLTRMFCDDGIEFVIGGEIVPVSFGDGLLNFCDLPGFQLNVASGFHRMPGLKFYQCRHFGSRADICKAISFCAYHDLF